MRLQFDFYGVRLDVIAPNSKWQFVLDQLQLDFHYFLCTKDSSRPATLQIRLAAFARGASLNVRLLPLFRTKMCRVRGWGWVRACEFDPHLWMIGKNQRHRRQFWVFGQDVTAVYEVVYVAILSAVGEELDNNGYHRVHALGFLSNGKRVLIPLPSRGGKSSLATLMLRDERYQIYSDETPLLKDGQIFPFPIRIALHPIVAESFGIQATRIFERKRFERKVLMDIPRSRIANAGALDFWVYFGSSKLLCRFKFIFEIVWGLGTPQMAEHMLRLPNMGRLAIIAYRRGLLAFNLNLKTSPIYIRYTKNIYNLFELVKAKFTDN
jgi:hypothetical protein